MRYTTITCDRCRARIDGPMTVLEPAGELAGALPRIDLCGPCGRALLAWLRSAAALGSAAEGSPEDEGGGRREEGKTLPAFIPHPSSLRPAPPGPTTPW